MKKYYQLTSGENFESVISFNGAIGYQICRNATPTFMLLYSTGMMSIGFDLTEEIENELKAHFSN